MENHLLFIVTILIGLGLLEETILNLILLLCLTRDLYLP